MAAIAATSVTALVDAACLALGTLAAPTARRRALSQRVGRHVGAVWIRDRDPEPPAEKISAFDGHDRVRRALHGEVRARVVEAGGHVEAQPRDRAAWLDERTERPQFMPEMRAPVVDYHEDACPCEADSRETSSTSGSTAKLRFVNVSIERTTIRAG